MKKSEIPKWMAITEAEAIIEADGQNLYFASLEDAKKVYKFAIDYCHQHHRTVDFKRPRRLQIGKDKDATFIAVQEEPKAVANTYASFLNSSKGEPCRPNKLG